MKLFTKEVDKSVLYYGISIPEKYQKGLLEGLQLSLEYGASTKISIRIGQNIYEAQLGNQKYNKEKYPDHVPLIKITYSRNSEIAKELRCIFAATNYYINIQDNNPDKKRYIAIPDGQKEFITINLKGKNQIEFICKKIENTAEEKFIQSIDDDGLKKIALDHSKNEVKEYIVIEEKVVHRDPYISEYAKRLANGVCQLCKKEAPFKKKNGDPYLESHHIQWLSKGGRDTIENVVALCPNCHRKMHVLNEQKDIEELIRIKYGE